MYEARYATREDIDAAMRFGCGLPMGPLALLDLIGLDTAYEILDTMYAQSRDRRHAPAPLLKQMVTAGLLGRKSGRGLLHLRRAGLARGRRRRARPRPRGRRTTRRPAPVPAVGVVGSGTMATGIVEVFAKAGLRRRLPRPAARTRSPRVAETIEESLDKAVRARQAHRGRPRTRPSPGSPAPRGSTTSPTCDLVVEAVVEELDVKQALFAALDEICKPGAVLATTTSSLPVIECAMATCRPADVVGLHFFNPAPVMKLVEVVPTVRPRPTSSRRRSPSAQRLGSTPVVCGDRAGFIVNALLFPYLNDAVKMLEAHYATADDIDSAMKLGLRLPDGPVRAARRRRAGRLAGDPADAVPGVPRAGLRPGAAAGAPGHRRATSAARPAAASATTPLAQRVASGWAAANEATAVLRAPTSGGSAPAPARRQGGGRCRRAGGSR